MAARSLPSGDQADDDGIVAEINITPLTDIFLVLLIIFMVTTSVVSNQGKEVEPAQLGGRLGDTVGCQRHRDRDRAASRSTASRSPRRRCPRR